jgi:serine/threonine protein kinase
MNGFVLIEKLGEGGFGEVWRARTEVAIKVSFHGMYIRLFLGRKRLPGIPRKGHIPGSQSARQSLRWDYASPGRLNRTA